MIVLSHFQAGLILEARNQKKQSVEVSPDLGLTIETVQCSSEGVSFTSGEVLSWQDVETIFEQQNSCFLLEEGTIRKVQFFSEETGRAYSLYPTGGAPTMLVSGIPMHRIKDTDPYQDTKEKTKTLHPLVGRVLDTATGLGYTAIEAARTADYVMTIELDPVALEVARCNPWSRVLFGNPKIDQRIGDSFDVIETLPDGSFSNVIHDPPVLSLAGHLYSLDFYIQLYRVLRSGGKLFHYIGDPASKSGRITTAGVLKRLEQAGFRQLQRAPRAFGVTARK